MRQVPANAPRVLRLLLALLAVAVAPVAAAVPPLVIGDVPTADPGTLELFAGVERVRSGATEWSAPADELVLGISERQELTLEAPFLVEPGGRGVGDLVLGTKVVLLPEAEGRPGIAASLEWKLANGATSTGVGSGSNEVGLLVRTQKTLGALTVIGNAGYTLVGDARIAGVRERRRDTAFLGAGGELALLPRLSALADAYWRSADVPGEPARAAGDLGLKVRLAGHLSAHAAVGTSLRPDGIGGPDSRVYVGVKGEIPIW